MLPGQEQLAPPLDALVLAKCLRQQHNACMPSITVRNVPPEVRDELAARAARAGQSLQEHLRTQLIELATKPSMHQIMERARARVRATGSRYPADEILADRDADRT